MGFPDGSVVKNLPANVEDVRDVGLGVAFPTLVGISRFASLNFFAVKKLENRTVPKTIPIFGTASTKRWYCAYRISVSRLPNIGTATSAQW